MVNKPPKRPRDPNQLAKLIVDLATGEKADPKDTLPTQAQKSGERGGAARANNLTSEQRISIARKAAKDRWGAKSPVRVPKEQT
jgi:hypothetical protein